VSTPRQRLAFVGPLPPVRSGIADYARDLLPHVARHFEIEVFVDDRQPSVEAGGGIPVRPAAELRERADEFHHVVYQLGNNLHHRFVLELAHELPGIVVLHDLVLHHLYEEIAGVEDEWEAYGEALRQSYGAIGADVMRWKRWRLASERENFALPLFEVVAARSRGILVHSGWAAGEVRRRLPEKPVRRIAMGIPPEPPLDVEGARRRLGLAPAEVVVGAFGFITPIKRLDVLARALRRVWPRCAELRLVLIGEASAGMKLDEIFMPTELGDGSVLHRGYVSAQEYRDWMAATDVAVNLRFPSAGETSASLLRLLGEAKCTLVSAYRQFLEMPPEVAVRIPLGADEEPALASELLDLARNAERRRRIGEAARAFVATEHSMDVAANDFRRAVEDVGAVGSPASLPPIVRFEPSSRSVAIRGRVQGIVELRSSAGSSMDVDLSVRNESVARWIATPEPAGGHVGVGADLFSADGALVARFRPALLRRDLRPGEGTCLRLQAEAPQQPGDYSIQPTIIHFGRGDARAAGRPIRLVVTPEASPVGWSIPLIAPNGRDP